MRVTIEISEKNEATAYPYWMIINPQQNFKTNDEGVHNIAAMITGPFFSREEAEGVLKATHYNYGTGAKVYCCSGHKTKQYRELMSERK